MAHSHTIDSVTWRFPDLKTLLARASPHRSGDALAGIAAQSAEERMAARMALADLPLAAFLSEALIPYEEDDVTRLILDSRDKAALAPVSSLTVGDFRNWLLSSDPEKVNSISKGLIPEMAAAVSKLMRNQDLVSVARKCRVVTRFRNTIGVPGWLSVRLQPNHPTDDPRGIAASMLDGLLYGCGDAVIGINPAGDGLAIPTQSCVLTHVSGQIQAIGQGAPVDLVFQSIGGTQKTNESFGITQKILREACDAARSLKRGTVGDNVMYFETGQGSSLSAGAHHGCDQQTLEARAYGVARAFEPLLVNSVVGFIGPEYLFDGKQIVRAGLEDHFCGKLLGVPLGVDVCYTNHAEADQDDMDTLLTLLGAAGVAYIMGVPGADDVMLNYQSTSFHDALYLREVMGLKRAPEFEAWLEKMGVVGADGRLLPQGSPLLLSYAKELS